MNKIIDMYWKTRIGKFEEIHPKFSGCVFGFLAAILVWELLIIVASYI